MRSKVLLTHINQKAIVAYFYCTKSARDFRVYYNLLLRNYGMRKSYLQLTAMIPPANLFRLYMVPAAKSSSVFQGTIIQSTHASWRQLDNYPNFLSMNILVELIADFLGSVLSSCQLEEASGAARRLAISLTRIGAQI
jgi:hypothetical protein